MFKKRSSSTAAIVGLDLDPGHVAAAEVTVNGSLSLKRGAVAQLRPGIVRDGEVAVNPSGGLVSRGHPIGATGLLMMNEIALQLRGEALPGVERGTRRRLRHDDGRRKRRLDDRCGRRRDRL